MAHSGMPPLKTLLVFSMLAAAAICSTASGLTTEKVFRVRGARFSLENATAPDCKSTDGRPTCRTLVVKLPPGSWIMGAEAFVKNSAEEQWYGPCPSEPRSRSTNCAALIGSIRLLDGYQVRRSAQGIELSSTVVNWAKSDRDIRLVVHYSDGPLYDDALSPSL